MEDSEYRQKVAIVAAAHGAAASSIATTYFCLNIPKEPHIDRKGDRDRYMDSILTNEDKCRANLRMGSYAFKQLCGLISRQGTIEITEKCSLEEMVMRFLHLLSHDVRHRVLEGRFYRSRETISRQFNQVLNCVVQLYKCLVADHLDVVHGGETPSQISNDPRYAKYFKDCLGALDGTHVNANVPLEEQDRFRGRKIIPTQNVLAACSFDLRFTYVLVGWEGSAHDQKVLDNALVRSNPLHVPLGKYYLVDGGYTHQPGFLAPYRGIGYHLNETKGRKPQNEKELFNKRHSSLRNAIERAFGVLKKRWPLLSHNSFYPYKTQVKIVLACFVLHNHIMVVDPEDSFLKESDKELAASEEIENDETAPSTNQAGWVHFRDDLAHKMFVDYNKRKKWEGKKNGRKWDPSVMKNVAGELCKVTNEEVRVTHIENRLRQMRTEYVNYKDLKEKSGGSRDLINNAIDFPPEVWSEIFANPKEKKKYGAFKERGPKWNFEKLALVMGNYHATGSYSFMGLDDNDEENTDLPSNKETIDLEESEESGSCARSTNPSQPKRQHGIRRQAFDEMKDMLGSVNSNLEKLRESVDPLHFGKLLRKAIDDVKDFSEKYLNAAFRILMKNRVDGEIYILSNEEGRKDILKEMSEQIGDL